MHVENERVKNTIKLIIGLTILIVVLFVWDLIVNRKGNVKDILNNIITTKFQDSYNGVYTYTEELGYKISAFTGCSLSEINNYLLVINDDYYAFRSSCMGTYLKDKGKTDDLNIVAGDKAYSINYKDHLYERDYKVTSIIPNNAIADAKGAIDLNSLPGIVKETEFEGNYYDINRVVAGLTSNIYVYFTHLEGEQYSIRFSRVRSGLESQGATDYTYIIKNIDKMPLYYTFGDNLVMLERESTNSTYSYKFKVYTLKDGITYDLKNMFPITIDNEILNYDKSVYIVYDKSNRLFRMFVGNNKEFCVKNGDKDKVAYYEFEIKYNYSTNEFERPEYIKKWYENSDCSYINGLLKEAV